MDSRFTSERICSGPKRGSFPDPQPIQGVGVGMNVDLGGRVTEECYAHAYGICHVKDGEENEQGKMVHVDLARTFGILKKNGYKGYCSIEYDAPGDPYKPTAELVEKTVQFLS